MREYQLIATSTFGLEAVTAEELRRLGYDRVRIEETGRVAFTADLAAIPRANLWLRAAGRVLVRVGSFTALTYDELFEGVKALPWPDWLPADACFPVVGKCVRSQLMSISDCQAIVKKAVAEKMKTSYGGEWCPETGPNFRIEAALHKDVATLTLDTSGAGLHKRGYRTLAAPAPLKETLAAGMIMLSHWHPELPLADPFCGSGTIPIEAALLGQNIAPGIRRTFASETWPCIPAALWSEARCEAADLAERRALRISGTDLDPEALRLAEYHAGLAGVSREISLKVLPLADLKLESPAGCLIGNPPYGERIGERQAIEEIFRALGLLRRSAPGWSFTLLASYPAFELLFGRKADKRRKLYNGGLECQYYQYRPYKGADR